MKRILFTGRQLRVRRRETILNPPQGIIFIPQQKLSEMKEDYLLSNQKKKNTYFQKIKGAIQYGNIIPKKFLKEIDLIYSPGKLILNKFPHVIELDNLGALTYYNLNALILLKPLIRWQLESNYCKGIVCLSKACEKSIKEFFKSEKINQKTTTIYPHVKEQKNKHEVTNEIKLLFISTNFYLKGGKELLACMAKIKSKKISLTILTKKENLKEKHLKQIEADNRINLIESNLNKEQISKKYYQTHDILVVPTYQDSFGMVFLEAIAHGMTIISTNQYNLPELVKHETTGYLINPPFYYFEKKTNIPNNKVWSSNHQQRTENEKFPKITKQIKEIIEKLVREPSKVNELKTNSKQHYLNNFNEEKRLRELKKILER